MNLGAIFGELLLLAVTYFLGYVNGRKVLKELKNRNKVILIKDGIEVCFDGNFKDEDINEIKDFLKCKE